MYKIIWGVSLSPFFLKEKCLSSVIIGKAFKKCMRMCVNVGVDLGVSEKKIVPIIVVASGHTIHGF